MEFIHQNVGHPLWTPPHPLQDLVELISVQVVTYTSKTKLLKEDFEIPDPLDFLNFT